MKRLDIIVEGQSEREFISQLIAPYLEKCGVIESYYVSPIVIRTNPNYRGGMTKYSHLKDEILKSLSSSNPDLIVSTLIDFFRLPSPTSRKFAEFVERRNKGSRNTKIYVCRYQ